MCDVPAGDVLMSVYAVYKAVVSAECVDFIRGNDVQPFDQGSSGGFRADNMPPAHIEEDVLEILS